MAISDRRKLGMAKKVIATCGGAVRGKTVGLLGLAFNPTPSTPTVRAAFSSSF